MFLIRLNDHLHQLMPHNILVGEVYEFDPFEVSQNLFGFLNAAFLAAGKIDLGHVAGDDGF